MLRRLPLAKSAEDSHAVGDMDALIVRERDCVIEALQLATAGRGVRRKRRDLFNSRHRGRAVVSSLCRCPRQLRSRRDTGRALSQRGRSVALLAFLGNLAIAHQARGVSGNYATFKAAFVCFGIGVMLAASAV